MRTIFLACVGLSIACSVGNAQVTLSAGSSYTYRFSTLPFQRNVTFGIAEPSGALFLYADPAFPSQLGQTNSYQVEMFEGEPNQNPILSRVITGKSSIHDTNYRVPNSWGDLQGSIRVTAISGSIVLNGFSFQASTAASPAGFDVYSTDRIFLPGPPPPPVLSILSSGTSIVLSWPVSGEDFILQANSSVGSEGEWKPLTNAVVQNGQTMSVTLEGIAAGRYFRLK